MSATDFRPGADEPAVRQPELAAFVELARAQRVPTVRIDTSTLLAAVAKRRAARVRWTGAAVVLATAAVALLWVAIDRRAWVQSTETTRDEAPRVLDGARDGGETREVVREPSVKAVVVEAPVVEPTVEPTVVDAPVQDEDAKPEEDAALDAGELARRAEKAMGARRRDEAIKLLTTLVRKFPKAPEAKTALLDLGRLLRDDGRPDHARCAYQLLVERWPSEATAPEITRVLASLGDGPKCRGLKPQR